VRDAETRVNDIDGRDVDKDLRKEMLQKGKEGKKAERNKKKR
jgi:hypothetical protein